MSSWGAKKEHYLKPTVKAKCAPKKTGKLIKALNEIAGEDEDGEDIEIEEVEPEDDDSARVPLDRLQGITRDTKPAWMKKMEEGKVEEEQSSMSNAMNASEEADALMGTVTDKLLDSGGDEDTTVLPKAKGPKLSRARMLMPLPKPIVTPEASSASSSSLAKPKAAGARLRGEEHTTINPNKHSQPPKSTPPKPPSTPPPGFVAPPAVAPTKVPLPYPLSPPGLATNETKPPSDVPAASPPTLESPPGLASNEINAPGAVPAASPPILQSPPGLTPHEINTPGAVPAGSLPTLQTPPGDAKAPGVLVATPKPGGFTSPKPQSPPSATINDSTSMNDNKGSNETIGGVTSKSAAIVAPKPAATTEAATSKSAFFLKPSISTPANATGGQSSATRMNESTVERAPPPPPPPPPPQASDREATTSNIVCTNDSTIPNQAVAQKVWQTDWNAWDSNSAASFTHSERPPSEVAAEKDRKQFYDLYSNEREVNCSLRRELEGFIAHSKQMQEGWAEASQHASIQQNWKLEKRCEDLQAAVETSTLSNRKLQMAHDELFSRLQVLSATRNSQMHTTDGASVLRGELQAAFVDKMDLHRRCEEFEHRTFNIAEVEKRCEQLQVELKARMDDATINANLYKADKEGLEQMWRQSERKATEAITLAEELRAKEQQAVEAWQSEAKACSFFEARGKGYETIACEQTAAKLIEAEAAESIRAAATAAQEKASKEEAAARKIKQQLKQELKEVEEKFRKSESKTQAMADMTKASLVEELGEKTKSEQASKSKLEQDVRHLRECLEKAEDEVGQQKRDRDLVGQQKRDRDLLEKTEAELDSQRCLLNTRLVRFENDERARIREDIAKAREEDNHLRRDLLDKKLEFLSEEKEVRLKDEEATMRGQLDRQITKYQIKLEASQENYNKAREENTGLRGKLVKVETLKKYYEEAEVDLAKKLSLSESAQPQESTRQAFVSSSSPDPQLLHRVAVATGNVTALEKENEILERKLEYASRLRREAFRKVHVLRHAFRLHRAQSAFDVEEQQRVETRMDEVEERAHAAEQALDKYKRGAKQTLAMWNSILGGDPDDMDLKDDNGVRSASIPTNWADKVKDSEEKDLESVKKQESEDEPNEDAASSADTLLEDESAKSSPRAEQSDIEKDQETMHVPCSPERGDDTRPCIGLEGHGIAIVYKPPGWTCTTSSSKKTYGMQRIQDWITRTLGGRHEYIRNCKDEIFGLAHRLDCDTSGPLVLATNANTMKILKRSMQSGHWYKEYLALMHGLIPESRWAGRISYKLNSKFRPGQGQLTKVCNEKGKHAETHYQAVQFYRRQVGNKVNYYTLVRCRIVTGRTHQIRVHLAALGERLGLRPRGLVGDSKYAFPFSTLRDDNVLCNRIFLHEQILHLPALGEENVGAEWNKPLNIESPLPDDLRRALGKLEPDEEQNAANAKFREFLRKSSDRALPEPAARRRVEVQDKKPGGIKLVPRPGA